MKKYSATLGVERCGHARSDATVTTTVRGSTESGERRAGTGWSATSFVSVVVSIVCHTAQLPATSDSQEQAGPRRGRGAGSGASVKQKQKLAMAV